MSPWESSLEVKLLMLETFYLEIGLKFVLYSFNMQ